jgi:undecaprenyl-diphosphatase
MVRSNEGLARFDLSAARWGASHATGPSTDVLRAVSQIGGTIGSILIALAVALTVVVRRSLRPRAVFGFLAAVMVGESVLVALVKSAVDRARPDIDRLTGFSGASFPSGHAATAAATLAAVALLLGAGQDRRRRALLGAVLAAIAACVAASRVFLGVHWLTDVVAGLVLGWTWFAVCSIAFGGRLVRFAEPVEAAEEVLTTSAARAPNA